MHSVSDAPHAEQRSFAFPTLATRIYSPSLYIVPAATIPPIMPLHAGIQVHRRHSGANRNLKIFSEQALRIGSGSLRWL
jgi:hypothetical protein